MDSKRRDFLSKFLGLWSIATVVPFLHAVVEFITPPKLKEIAHENIRAASLTDLPSNSAKIFKFNKEPVILVHTPSGQFKAFSARCTHLGCVVQYRPEGTPHFECNCHGSQFDLNGKNISGPAPEPLAPFRTKIDQSNIIVSKV